MTNKKDRNRSQLMYDDDDDKPNEKLDKIILKEKERLEREKSERKNSEKKQDHNKNGRTLERSSSKSKDSSSNLASTSKTTKNDSVKSSVDESKLDKKPVPLSNRNKRQSSPINVSSVKRMKETKDRVYKPFNKLLEGVVLVISGIQVRVPHLSCCIID